MVNQGLGRAQAGPTRSGNTNEHTHTHTHVYTRTHTHCMNSYLHPELRHFALAAWRGVPPLRERTTCCGATEGPHSPTATPFPQIIVITRPFQCCHKKEKAWDILRKTTQKEEGRRGGLRSNLPTRREIIRSHSLLPCWIPVTLLVTCFNTLTNTEMQPVTRRTHVASHSRHIAQTRLAQQAGIWPYLRNMAWSGPQIAPNVRTMNQVREHRHCGEMSAHWPLGHGKHTRVTKWRNIHNYPHCSPRICAKGYQHEWWSLGEFHNTRLKRVNSGSHAADPKWIPTPPPPSYPLGQGYTQAHTQIWATSYYY